MKKSFTKTQDVIAGNKNCESSRSKVRLTTFSHGSGCGCKISPQVLDEILDNNLTFPDNNRLIVGNDSRDDAAVYSLGNGRALISTTDFFMPIVDDPFDFGRIAAANALSDVYAMGGSPALALGVLSWPVDKIPATVARDVIAGARDICHQAGAVLAGGHSIAGLEPMFGLAVNGFVSIKNIKQNNTARPGNLLFLTKPLGIGILTTAEKKGLLLPEHNGLATASMVRLNIIGTKLGSISGVTAMTDVSGFGLLGHLAEMCRGSKVGARIFFDKIALLSDIHYYLRKGSIPGGCRRNWESYKDLISQLKEEEKLILADPQTSGGLLIAVDSSKESDIKNIFCEAGLADFTEPIGEVIGISNKRATIEIV